MRGLLALVPVTLLAACGGGGEAPRPARAAPAPSVPVPGPGRAPPPISADGVRGQSATMLVGLFGQPAADVREGPARKLQFGNSQCVLDAYLYPQGRGEAVATHVEARLRDGRPTDVGACAAALRRR